MHNKMIGIFIAILVFCVVLSGCGSGTDSHRTYMGFEKSEYVIVDEKDTHEGFHGDGSYYLILDCSSDSEAALSIVREWTPMPLSENLNLIMYGGTKNGVTYSFELAEEAHWPKIEHGFYRFADERSDNPADDSELFDRNSFNFEIAVYDTDRSLLYYFRYDT